MFNVEEFCGKITNIIGDELDLNYEKRSVINYGIFAFVQIFMSVILVTVIGGALNVLIESLIILTSICILRQSSGGAHASSPGICTFVGTILSVGMGFVVKNMNLTIMLVIIAGGIIFIWSYYTVYKLAPVDSAAKPIRKVEKIKRLKKSSILILTVYFIVVLVNIIGYHIAQNENLLVYSGCIYIGLLWQVFSLTKSGHVVLGKIDALFK